MLQFAGFRRTVPRWLVVAMFAAFAAAAAAAVELRVGGCIAPINATTNCLPASSTSAALNAPGLLATSSAATRLHRPPRHRQRAHLSAGKTACRMRILKRSIITVRAREYRPGRRPKRYALFRSRTEPPLRPICVHSAARLIGFAES